MVADASRFQSPEELWAAVEADARDRGGRVAGVQLFGDEAAAPAPAEYWPEAPADVKRLALEPGAYQSFFQEYLAAVRAGDLEGPASYAEALFTPNYAAMALSDAEGTLG